MSAFCLQKHSPPLRVLNHFSRSLFMCHLLWFRPFSFVFKLDAKIKLLPVLFTEIALRVGGSNLKKLPKANSTKIVLLKEILLWLDPRGKTLERSTSYSFQ